MRQIASKRTNLTHKRSPTATNSVQEGQPFKKHRENQKKRKKQDFLVLGLPHFSWAGIFCFCLFLFFSKLFGCLVRGHFVFFGFPDAFLVLRQNQKIWVFLVFLVFTMLFEWLALLNAICRTCAPFTYHDGPLARYLTHLGHFYIPRWPFCLLFVTLALLSNNRITVLIVISRTCDTFMNPPAKPHIVRKCPSYGPPPPLPAPFL